LHNNSDNSFFFAAKLKLFQLRLELAAAAENLGPSWPPLGRQFASAVVFTWASNFPEEKATSCLYGFSSAAALMLRQRRGPSTRLCSTINGLLAKVGEQSFVNC